MKVYKGFNKNLQCDPTGRKPFQYEIGGVYEEESAEVCDHGFHACENPIDVLTYYPPGSNRYCEADLDGVVKRAGDNTKVAGTKIQIGLEIGLKGIIQGALNFVMERTQNSQDTTSTTGNRAHAATTGYGAHAATTGNRAHAATTGDDAHAATTGDDAHAATTGYGAHAATTGYGAHAEVKGKNAIAASLGIESKAKGSLGCYIVCADWQRDSRYEWQLMGVKAAKVDGVAILPDVFYTLRDGEFVRVSE